MHTSHNKDIKPIYVALLFTVFGTIAPAVGLETFKDWRFLAPVILLLCAMTISNAERRHALFVKPYTQPLFYLYAVVTIYTLASSSLYFSTGFTYRNIVNIVLVFTPLIIANSISRICDLVQIKKIIDFLYYCFVGAYLLELILNDSITVTAIIKVFTSNLLTNSYYDTESGSSLIFCFYALYYLYLGERKKSFFAILLTILGAKRIAIFGLGFAILIFYLYPIFFKKHKKRNTLAIIGSVSGLALAKVWHDIVTGVYNESFKKLTGIHINQFFMGRIGRFERFTKHLNEEATYGLGLGLGYVENILYYSVNFRDPFHNDFFRLYLELGPVFFLLWLYIIIRMALRNRLALSATALLLVMAQTDNVIMYDRVMVSYLLIIIFSLKDRIIGIEQDIKDSRHLYLHKRKAGSIAAISYNQYPVKQH